MCSSSANNQPRITNAKTGQVARQLPEDFNFSQAPLLISVSDQGPMNQPGLDLLQYKLALDIHVMLDIYHRYWNDLKGAMTASSGALFRVMLQFSIYYSVSYGPSGSRAWMQRKIHQTQEFMDRLTAFDKVFTDNLPLICDLNHSPLKTCRNCSMR